LKADQRDPKAQKRASNPDDFQASSFSAASFFPRFGLPQKKIFSSSLIIPEMEKAVKCREEERTFSQSQKMGQAFKACRIAAFSSEMKTGEGLPWQKLSRRKSLFKAKTLFSSPSLLASQSSCPEKMRYFHAKKGERTAPLFACNIWSLHSPLVTH